MSDNTTGGGRFPAMGQVTMYGAPGVEWVPEREFVPLVPSAPPSEAFDRIAKAMLVGKRKLRVSAARDADGGIRVKVTLDGVLVSESLTPGASITVEADV